MSIYLVLLIILYVIPFTRRCTSYIVRRQFELYLNAPLKLDNQKRNNKKDPNDLANLGEKRMGSAIKEKPKFDPRDEARNESRFIGLKVRAFLLFLGD